MAAVRGAEVTPRLPAAGARTQPLGIHAGIAARIGRRRRRGHQPVRAEAAGLDDGRVWGEGVGQRVHGAIFRARVMLPGFAGAKKNPQGAGLVWG
jgi:hypothetical protein